MQMYTNTRIVACVFSVLIGNKEIEIESVQTGIVQLGAQRDSITFIIMREKNWLNACMYKGFVST